MGTGSASEWGFERDGGRAAEGVLSVRNIWRLDGSMGVLVAPRKTFRLSRVDGGDSGLLE